MESELKIKISGDSKKLQSELDKAGESTKKFNKTLQTLAKASAVAITGIGAALTYAVKKGADFETIQTQFEVLTGNVDDAAMAMKQLSDFSARTPFQFEDIAKASQKLLGFGFSVDQLTSKMQQIGDVSAAVGADIGELTLIYGQVAAAGKLTGERLLQMQERAIPIGPAIARTMGVAESSVRELVSAGKVTDEVFQKAFATLSQEGGVAFGGMEKRSQTLSGTISTLKDNVVLLAVEIGNKLLPWLKSVSFTLTNVTQDVKSFFEPKVESESSKLFKLFSDADDKISELQEKLKTAEGREGSPLNWIFGTPEELRAKITALEAERADYFQRHQAALKEQYDKLDATEKEREDRKKEEAAAKREEEEAIKLAEFEKDLIDAENQQLELSKKLQKGEENRTKSIWEHLNKRKKYEDLYAQEKIANFQSTMGTIATLSDSNSKILGGIGRAAGIAQATVSTYQAATMALASPPGPPWSFAYVGAVIAAGLANVARIANVKLAKGGIVMPSTGGTQATIGEAGSPEAVIPLDSPQAEEFGFGSLGGPIQIDINFAGDLAKYIEEQQIQNERLNISIRRAS